MGVTYDKRRKNWNARITISGKRVYLGSFPDERKALEAYLRVDLFLEMAKHFTLQNYRVPYVEDDTSFKWIASFRKAKLKSLAARMERLYLSVVVNVFKKKQIAEKNE